MNNRRLLVLKMIMLAIEELIVHKVDELDDIQNVHSQITYLAKSYGARFNVTSGEVEAALTLRLDKHIQGILLSD